MLWDLKKDLTLLFLKANHFFLFSSLNSTFLKLLEHCATVRSLYKNVFNE